MRSIGLIFFLITFSLKGVTAQTDTVKVYFNLASHQLTAQERHKLDSMAYYDLLPTNIKYGIIGYADYLGTEESNVTLSQNRANAVQAYLEGLGVKQEQIQTVTGKGEVNRESKNVDGYPDDRRVDIIIGGFKAPPEPVKKIQIVRKDKPKLDISTVKKDETIRLDNIFFLPGRHFVRESSYDELVKLYYVMADNPSLKIQIEGHICCMRQGSDGYDYDTQDFHLSTNRAKHIYDYLVEKGISKDRMTYKGFGNSRPLASPERTPADENMNRRVEIRITDK